MSEYCLQFLLLILLVIVMRRFKKGYMFSFVTAVFYGFTLDFFYVPRKDQSWMREDLLAP